MNQRKDESERTSSGHHARHTRGTREDERDAGSATHVSVDHMVLVQYTEAHEQLPQHFPQHQQVVLGIRYAQRVPQGRQGQVRPL